MKLTEAEREELDALRRTCDVLDRTFLLRSHWNESGYRRLVRSGLVDWIDPPEGFDRRKFAGARITPAGRAALSKAT